MARPREYDEHTRSQLIEAAGRRLSEGGPAAVTVRAVADDVGASTRAVYALFGSKEGMLRAMYVAGFEGLEAQMRAVGRSDDALADLYGLGMAYRHSALARPHLYPVMFGTAVAGFEPTTGDLELSLGTLARLQAAVQRCIDEGHWFGDAWSVTLQQWALVHGLASLELRGLFGSRQMADRQWHQALQAQRRGYAAPTTAAR